MLSVSSLTISLCLILYTVKFSEESYSFCKAVDENFANRLRDHSGVLELLVK